MSTSTEGLLLAWLLCEGAQAQTQTETLKITVRANAQNNPALEAIAAGKRATVLVDTPDTNGSAFCIHESGIFATNAHVVEGFSKVKVIIHPGEATQRTITARVSHYDDDKDLAVLIADPPLKTQVPGMAPLTVLPLGDSNGLFETMGIAIFGFPFGTDLALDDREMPSVTVTTGRISALRKLGGALKEIQFDAAANPGNSGGPVINEQGQVIGIVYAGVDGAQGLNFAIPAESLRGLLMLPEISFDIPKVPYAKRYEVQNWKVQIVPFTTFTGDGPGTAPKYSLDFAINRGGSWRNFQTSRMDPLSTTTAEFGITGVLVPQGGVLNGPTAYRITLRGDGRTLTTREGLIEFDAPTPGGFGGQPANQNPAGQTPPQRSDAPVLNPANGHWYQCINNGRNLGWNEAKAAAEALRHQGLKGHLASITSAAEGEFIRSQTLGALTAGNDKAWIGGIQNPGADEPDGGWQWTTKEPLKYVNWAAGEPNNAGDENVMQMLQTGQWNDSRDSDFSSNYVVEFEPVNGTPANTQPIDTPRVEDDHTVIDLPSQATAAASGGDGRYLLFYMKSEEKVAVFDAQEKKIVRYIPAPGANVLLAASQEKLVLLLADQNILQRWNLATGQREQSAPLEDDKLVKSVAMGAASKGPLLIVRGNTPTFFDLATLQPIEIIDAQTNAPIQLSTTGNASAAPDGSAFAFAGESNGRQMQIVVLDGNKLSKYPGPGTTNAYAAPDGRWWYSSDGIFTGEGKPVVAEQLREGGPNSGYQILVPAVSPTYFLTLKNVGADNFRNRKGQMQFTVYSANDRRALTTPQTLPEISSRTWQDNRSANIPLEKRISYQPERNLLITLSDNLNQILIRQFDLKSAISQDGNKYFLVASTPPRKVAKSATYSYQLNVLSQAAGLKYSVESGPAGLTISPTGLVEWKVPADFASGEVTVLIAVSNGGGQELYHTFKVQVK